MGKDGHGSELQEGWVKIAMDWGRGSASRPRKAPRPRFAGPGKWGPDQARAARGWFSEIKECM